MFCWYPKPWIREHVLHLNRKAMLLCKKRKLEQARLAKIKASYADCSFSLWRQSRNSSSRELHLIDALSHAIDKKKFVMPDEAKEKACFLKQNCWKPLGQSCLIMNSIRAVKLCTAWRKVCERCVCRFFFLALSYISHLQCSQVAHQSYCLSSSYPLVHVTPCEDVLTG